MAISPPRSPPTLTSSPPTGAANCFSRLQIDEMTLGEAAIVPESGPTPLCSAVHTWGVSEEEMHSAAYVFFEEAKDDVVAWQASGGKPRISKGAVLPQPVFADALRWSPLLSETGERGFAFSLLLEGEPQATIEVIESRIVVVHGSFSPLSVEAGLVSTSTRLVFEGSHQEELQRVVDSILKDDELGYLPTGEVLAGRGLDKLVLRRRGGDGCQDDEAQKAWNLTKTRLKQMNSAVIAGIDAQNGRELAAAGVSAKEFALPNLRTVFS